MNQTERDDLAERLTRQVVEVSGVRGIYPQSVVAAIVGRLVRSAHSAATGLLHVATSNGSIKVIARLATDSAVPTPETIAAVAAALEAALPDLGLDLDIEIEIAHID